MGPRSRPRCCGKTFLPEWREVVALPSSQPIAYRADWIFPVAGPPVRDGVLEVDAAGRIVSVRNGPDRDAIDLGGFALIPGLVNAHVHLEFSDLSSPIGPTTPFSEWLRNVVSHRRNRTESAESAVRRGLAELRRTGTAAFGEIATTDLCLEFGLDAPEPVVFRELIGPSPESWPGLLSAAERHLVEGDAGKTVGLSPHAPYTVPQRLFDQSVDLAGRLGAPVAIHLAETAAELEFLSRGAGELVEMMRSIGLWRAELHPAGRRPIDWLRPLAKAKRGLVIHGNYLDQVELDFIAANPSLSVVYCPRTHQYFGHPPHPFRRLLDQGGRVALGTDGRSSNPDLDLWREARWLRARHPDLPSDTILNLITRSGAEALGIEDRHGILAPGRPANFVAVRVNDPRRDRPPDLFAEKPDVRRVFHRGNELDCHDGSPLCPP